MINRLLTHTVLILTATLLAPPILAQPAAVALNAEEVVRLPGSQGRQVEVRIWRAQTPSVVIVFSPGGNGEPAYYHRMLSALAERGFMVLAPVHSDPLARGNLSGSGGMESFVGRIEDLAIARNFAKSAYSNLPMVVMGHSFGSMMSSLAVGAMTPAGPQSDPAVKALITFSSPGLIPGVVTKESFKNISTPVLTITGDRDVVQGFATEWTDHRAIYDNSTIPGSTLVVIKDGGHNIISDADERMFNDLVELISIFVRANALNKEDARTRMHEMSVEGAKLNRR